MKKDIYIGPFVFHVEADEGLASFLDMESFEMPLDFEYTHYQVTIDSGNELPFLGRLIHKTDFFAIYQEDDTEHRYYYQNYDGEDHYYLRASLSEGRIRIRFYTGAGTFGRSFNLWQYLFLEELLKEKGGFILHSSSVLWRGKALLFSAPSGTGKSTQADLWKRYENAEGINGDRNIVISHNGSWYCCGLPWHGSSADCKNIMAPIRCIALIRQDPIDAIRPLTGIKKVKYLYAEMTKNSWNMSFVEDSLNLLEKLSGEVEILQLNCTMNQTAVDCLKDYIKD